MDWNEYQKWCLSRAGTYHDGPDKRRILAFYLLGLCGEAGECADLLKKVEVHSKPYDPEELRKELGDVLWYLAMVAHLAGYTLEEVMRANVDKLLKRYPNGFTPEAAQARADEAPPPVVEECGFPRPDPRGKGSVRCYRAKDHTGPHFWF